MAIESYTGQILPDTLDGETSLYKKLVEHLGRQAGERGGVNTPAGPGHYYGFRTVTDCVVDMIPGCSIEDLGGLTIKAGIYVPCRFSQLVMASGDAVAFLAHDLDTPAAFPEGLTHRWRLNESSGDDRVDSVGSLDLEETGGTVDSATGKHGGAARFLRTSGVEPYLDATPLADIASYTIAVWFKLSAATGTLRIILDAGGDSLTSAVITTAGAVWNLTDEDAVASAAVSLDTWHLLVFVRAAGDFSISLDGAALTTATAEGTPPAPTGIRLRCSRTGDGIIGEFDELMYFNAALNNTQIAALWNGGDGLFAS